MRTLILSAVLLLGFAFSQSVVTFGGNYTTAAGEQRSINLIPSEDGNYTLIDARADGMDQHKITITPPAGSEAVSATLPSGELKLSISGDTYQIMVRPDMPPVVLSRRVSNP